MATRAFGQITGIKEIGEGKEAEVEYTWGWAPNAAGTLLDGAYLYNAGYGGTLQLHGYPYADKASCSLYDDGWRCKIANMPSEQSLMVKE